MPASGEIRSSQELRAFAVPALRDLLSGHSVFLAAGAGEGGLLGTDGTVRPQFLAWRTFSDLLRASRVLGEIPLSVRAEAWAFRRGGQTCVAAWTRQPGESVRVEMASIHPIVSVDLLGRQEVLHPVDGRVHLEIGSLPRFFLDLSSGWLKTRSSMRLDRPVQASRRATGTIFHLENGFETSLEGTLILTPPEGWTVSPLRLGISLAPGEGLSFPLSLVPASYEVTAGEFPRLLGARVEFPDPALAPLESSVSLPLESPVLESHAVTYRKAGEVLVSQRVMNRGTAPVFCDAFLTIPGRPELRRPLGHLKPGEIRTVEYLFPAGPLTGREILSGVRELDGERRFAIERLP